MLGSVLENAQTARCQSNKTFPHKEDQENTIKNIRSYRESDVDSNHFLIFPEIRDKKKAKRQL